METNKTNCEGCRNVLQDNAKFCDKCGVKVEKIENKEPSNKSNLENGFDLIKPKNEIGNIGSVTIIFGILRIAVGLLLLNNTGSELSSGHNFSYDTVVNVVEGFIFLILGSKINEGVNNNTKKYIWAVVIISAILIILGLAMGTRPFLPIILLVYSIRSLNKLKKIVTP